MHMYGVPDKQRQRPWQLGLGRGLSGSEAWLFGAEPGHEKCERIPCSKGVSSRLASRKYQVRPMQELLLVPPAC
jgi:hypothetical protein